MSILLELREKPDVLKNLSKPPEDAVFTVAVLKKAACANISTIEDRIVCQKVIYFANCLGISPKYDFNLYIHGPYSPALANDLFILSSFFDRVTPVDFMSSESQEKFEKLNGVLLKLGKKPRYLELASTLTFFKNLAGDLEVAMRKTIEIKGASREELVDIERYLKEGGLL